MDTSEFWVLLSLSLEQRHALRPQLQDSLARICTDAWKACLRACTFPDAVRLVLSTALDHAESHGTCLRSGMLLELLERSLYMEESDDVAEDLLLKSLPVILPANTADASCLLTEALKSLKATWGHHAPSKAQSMREALVCGAICLVNGWIIPHISYMLFPGTTTEMPCGSNESSGDVDTKALSRFLALAEASASDSSIVVSARSKGLQYTCLLCLHCPQLYDKCCGLLAATACSARVPLPLRHVAAAGFLDCAFMHAADMGQDAWMQLLDLLQHMLCRSGVVKLQLLALAGAGRLLLHRSAACAEQGATEALLMPLVDAKQDAGLQHADVQRSLHIFFMEMSKQCSEDLANAVVYCISIAFQEGCLTVSMDSMQLFVPSWKDKEGEALRRRLCFLTPLINRDEVPLHLVHSAIHANLVDRISSLPLGSVQEWLQQFTEHQQGAEAITHAEWQ